MASDQKFRQVDAAVVPRFAGVATFMRTQRHEISAEVDIGLVGVPFDIGVNFRAGARQGPAGVREASRLIRKSHPTSGIAPFEVCNVADLGDAPVNPLSLDRSIEMIEASRSSGLTGASPRSATLQMSKGAIPLVGWTRRIRREASRTPAGPWRAPAR